MNNSYFFVVGIFGNKLKYHLERTLRTYCWKVNFRKGSIFFLTIYTQDAFFKINENSILREASLWENYHNPIRS